MQPDPPTAVHADVAHEADARLGDRVAWTAAAALTAVGVTIVRLLVARGRDEFSLWPDEPAQLAMSRFLGGGVPWTMYDHSTWQPGYATVLSPAYWFTDDPVTVFHSALALNAVLGGVAAFLLVILVRRLTSLRPRPGAIVAGIVALAPTALFTTEFVWSESLVAVLFVATLLLLLRFCDSPTLLRGILAGTVAALAFATHSRMMPLAAVAVGLAIVMAIRRRISPGAALGVIACTAIAMMAVRLYAGFVFDRLWDEPSTTNSMGGVVDHLGSPGTTLIALAGQAWYLLVSTIGLVVYGTFALVRSTRDAGPTHLEAASDLEASSDLDTTKRRRRDAILVLVVVIACIIPSVLFMAGRMRPDQVVYGRYNDGVIAPVLIAGMAFLLTDSSVRRVVIAGSVSVVLTIGCASILLLWRRDVLDSDSGLEPMTLGLQPYMGGADSINVVGITVAAIAITLLVGGIALVARRIHRPTLTLGAVAVLVAFASSRTSDIIDDGWHGRGDLSSVAMLADDVLAGGVEVTFLLPDGESTDRLMLYQLYLPDNRFTVVENVADTGASRFVFARADDPILAETAEIVWEDPGRPWALWQR